MEKLHHGAKWIFRFRAYSALLFMMIVIYFFSLQIDNFSLQLTVIVIGLLLLMFVGEIYAQLSHHFWKYEFTHHEIKIEKGIIFKDYKSIPYERIQNVDIHRGILARLLGFSTLNIQTAGYSAVVNRSGFGGAGMGAEGSIPAVSKEGAEKIREWLIKKIHGKKSGL
jgi:putative membrane protein